jgi:hypothetical protein
MPRFGQKKTEVRGIRLFNSGESQFPEATLEHSPTPQ